MSFFERKGPFPLSSIIELINCDSKSPEDKKKLVININDLSNAKENELSFLNSIKYKDFELKTKASACITSSKLKKYLPKTCIKLEVKNVLLAMSLVAKKFFPKSDIDFPDLNLNKSDSIIKKYKKVSFGYNVLIGQNVQIGENSIIGSNSIIESNVQIGKNCIIGCNVVIKKTIIGDLSIFIYFLL